MLEYKTKIIRLEYPTFLLILKEINIKINNKMEQAYKILFSFINYGFPFLTVDSSPLVLLLS